MENTTTEHITQERLDRVIQVYRNGIQNWSRDEFFLKDCAYYEGAIKRASDHLGIVPQFKFINITEELQEPFKNGYEQFWV
jgi:hypothetical protein